MTVGIVTALPAEGQCLTGRRIPPRAMVNLAGGARLQLAGIGPENAAKAAGALIHYGCHALVSWGTAAGLDPMARSGDILVPSQIVLEGGESFHTHGVWRRAIESSLEPLNPQNGSLYQSNTIVSTIADKKTIFERSHAVALDMESGAIARVAAEAQVPFLAIRVILDNASMNLPKLAQVAVDESGRFQLSSTLKSLAHSWREFPQIQELHKGFRRAQRSMRRVASLLDSSMGLPATTEENNTP